MPQSKHVYQFFIRKLNNGQKYKSDKVFLSKKYSKITKERLNNNNQVLIIIDKFLDKSGQYLKPSNI